MSFKITVVEITEEIVMGSEEWTVIAERPHTKEEANNAAFGASLEGKTQSIYGYTPKKEIIEKTSREVYTQFKETLDLRAVIEAVNIMSISDILEEAERS